MLSHWGGFAGMAVEFQMCGGNGVVHFRKGDRWALEGCGDTGGSNLLPFFEGKPWGGGGCKWLMRDRKDLRSPEEGGHLCSGTRERS